MGSNAITGFSLRQSVEYVGPDLIDSRKTILRGDVGVITSILQGSPKAWVVFVGGSGPIEKSLLRPFVNVVSNRPEVAARRRRR